VKDGVAYWCLGTMIDISVPSILVIAFRCSSYFVPKRIPMFMADLMTGSKSLIFCETSMTLTPLFLRSLTALSRNRVASFGT